MLDIKQTWAKVLTAAFCDADASIAARLKGYVAGLSATPWPERSTKIPDAKLRPAPAARIEQAGSSLRYCYLRIFKAGSPRPRSLRKNAEFATSIA